MGKSLRVASRVAGALVLGGLSVPLVGVAPAAADTETIPASNAAYFNSLGVAKPDDAPNTPPNPANSADGVDPDHLPVAARPGAEEDKISFLYFELADIDPTATVSRATVKLKVAEGGGNRTYGTVTEESVIACKSGEEGFAGDDAGAIEQAPSRLCDAFKAPAKVSDDGKTWSFDVTSLAQEWVAVDNQGIALRPAFGSRGPFQIVFAPMTEHVLEVEYTVPALDDGTDVGTDVGTDTGTDLGGGGGGGGFTPVDSGGFVPAPAPGIDGGVDSGVTPPAPETAPQPVPQAAPPATGSQSVIPVASTRPTGTFWLGALVLAAALALVSLVMGDSAAAARAQRESRLSRTLRERQRGGRPGLATGRSAVV